MARTDGGEDAGEAEIVHSVEGEQVEQKLLPFFLTEEERMRLIQLPVRGKKEICQGFLKLQLNL